MLLWWVWRVGVPSAKHRNKIAAKINSMEILSRFTILMNEDYNNIMTLDQMIQGIQHWGSIEIARIRRDMKYIPASQ